jgi:hypothetical protein
MTDKPRTDRPGPVWVTLLPPSPPPPAELSVRALAALAGGHGPITLAAFGEPRRLSFRLAAGPGVPPAVMAESVRAAFPGAELGEAGPPAPDGRHVAAATWWPAEAGRIGDFAAAVTAALSGLPDGQCAMAAAILRPAPRAAGRRLEREARRALARQGDRDLLGALNNLASDTLASALAPTAGPANRDARPDHDRADQLRDRAAAGLVEVTLRTAWFADTEVDAEAGHEALAVLLEAAGLHRARRGHPVRTAGRLLDGYPERRARRHGLLTPAELSRLLRLPDPPPATMLRLGSVRRPPAGPLPADGIPLGRATGAHPEPVGLTVAELTAHTYVLGPSGTGKTALLARLVLGLTERRTGAVVLDPHGDLVRQVHAGLPAGRADRVDTLSFADPDRAVPINPLFEPTADPQAQANRAAATVAAFADIWQLTEATSPNLHRFLRLCLDTLIAAGRPRLADLSRVMDDPVFRHQLLREAGDPRLSADWQRFEKWSSYERTKTIRAVVNKADAFERDPVLRRVFGDAGPGLRLEDYLDGGRTLLVNLARGQLAEGTGPLLGSLVTTMLHQSAMARERVPPAQRRPAVAVLDEFHELGVASFAKLVTAVRKYRVGLVAANQNLASLHAVDRHLVETLLANAANVCAFRLSAEDARVLAGSFPGLSAADLTGQGRFEFYLRRQGVDGPEVVSARSLPPAEPCP